MKEKLLHIKELLSYSAEQLREVTDIPQKEAMILLAHVLEVKRTSKNHGRLPKKQEAMRVSLSLRNLSLLTMRSRFLRFAMVKKQSFVSLSGIFKKTVTMCLAGSPCR